jgi:chemotaxis response regulator CheB
LEDYVPIRVLVSDDSGAMRGAIVRLLVEDSALQVVGEARGFAQTVELTAALKPDIILLDLRMPDEKSFSPDALKVQLLRGAGCIVAMSIWNTDDAKALASRFGAKVLLDKANLFADLIPAIKRFCPSTPE